MSLTTIDTNFTSKRLRDYLKCFSLDPKSKGIIYGLNHGKIDGSVTGYSDIIYEYEKLGYFEITPSLLRVGFDDDCFVYVRLTDKGRELAEAIMVFRKL